MPKTSEEVLLKEVGDYLFTFLKYGNIKSYSKKIDTSLNINDMEKLLRIHFVLREDVIDFVSALPQRIRRIKTTTRKYNEEQRDKIRGRIDWQRTIKARCSNNDAFSPYHVELIERNYDIPENLILKELLGTIYSITSIDIHSAMKKDYPWLKEWTKDDLIEKLKDVYQRNIYLHRIKNDSDTTVTERMISNTFQSRNALYREAAGLLTAYRRLMDYDVTPAEAQELLRNTFIRPDKAEVLFELFWTFKVILALTDGHDNITFNIIDGEKNIVAEWEDENYRYRIYHDSTGSFNFHESWDDIEIPKNDGYLMREALVVKEWQGMSKALFDLDQGNVLWGGRPDIILEKILKSSNMPVQVFIGEVKYTDSVQYAAKGLKELMEYMALIRSKKVYFEHESYNIFITDKIKGWLFLDKVVLRGKQRKNISIIKTHDKNIEEKITESFNKI